MKHWTWKDKPEKFVNTDRVRPAAIDFERNGGYYTDAAYGTKEYYEYWDEQKRRCLEGYVVDEGTPDEMYVTGFHYHYLNFCPIDRAVTKVDSNGREYEVRIFDFPKFYDGDWKYFMAVEEAQFNKEHLSVLKARRKGYSYKAASMLCRNYYHIKKSKNFVFASKDEFLIGDAILSKAWDMMSFIDEHTAFTQPRLKDQDKHKESGYKVKKKTGGYVTKGSRSQIIGVTLGDNIQKVRGKAGELIFFEEAGVFPNLIKAWEIADSTMRQGNMYLGTMVAFGTGGTEDADFSGLDLLFRNPDKYGIYQVENIWDEGGAGQMCGWFVPDYENLDGFIDSEGNSLTKQAKAWREAEREKKRTGDRTSFDQHVAEHPFSPDEATLQVNLNLFPIADLQAQYNRVIAEKLYDKLSIVGELYNDPKTGRTKFKPNPKLNAVTQFPHNAQMDLTGAPVIYEAPYRNDAGEVPPNMYIICHDPYGQNQSADKTSLGAAYVIKQPNKFSRPDDMIVASYVGRPAMSDDYNANLFRLAEYYNAKIGFENDRGEVIPYAKRFRRLHQLQSEFQMPANRELHSSNVNRGFGMHMTEGRKNQGEIYLRDWLLTPSVIREDGTKILNLHRIYDPALLRELIRFHRKGNFDRVMALMIGMFHQKELFHVPVTQDGNPNDRSQDEFFDRFYGEEDSAQYGSEGEVWFGKVPGT